MRNLQELRASLTELQDQIAQARAAGADVSKADDKIATAEAALDQVEGGVREQTDKRTSYDAKAFRDAQAKVIAAEAEVLAVTPSAGGVEETKAAPVGDAFSTAPTAGTAAGGGAPDADQPGGGPSVPTDIPDFPPEPDRDETATVGEDTAEQKLGITDPLPKQHKYVRAGFNVSHAAYRMMRMLTDPVLRANNQTKEGLRRRVRADFLKMVGRSDTDMTKEQALQSASDARLYLEFLVLQLQALPTESVAEREHLQREIDAFVAEAGKPKELPDEGFDAQAKSLQGLYDRMVKDQEARRKNLWKDYDKYGREPTGGVNAHWEGGSLVSYSKDTEENGAEMARYLIAKYPEAQGFTYEMGYKDRTNWVVPPRYNENKAIGFLKECMHHGKTADISIDISRDDKEPDPFNISEAVREGKTGVSNYGGMKFWKWTGGHRYGISSKMRDAINLADLHAKNASKYGDNDVNAWAATVKDVHLKFHENNPRAYKRMTKMLFETMPHDMAAMLLSADTKILNQDGALRNPEELDGSGPAAPAPGAGAAEGASGAGEEKADDEKKDEAKADGAGAGADAAGADGATPEPLPQPQGVHTPRPDDVGGARPGADTKPQPPEPTVGLGGGQAVVRTPQEAKQTGKALLAARMLIKPPRLRYDASKNPPFKPTSERDLKLYNSVVGAMENARTPEEFGAAATVFMKMAARGIRAQESQSGNAVSKAMINLKRRMHGGDSRKHKAEDFVRRKLVEADERKGWYLPDEAREEMLKKLSKELWGQKGSGSRPDKGNSAIKPENVLTASAAPSLTQTTRS